MANPQSKEVNLTKRIVTSKGMRYCPVVLSPNGRVKPGLVVPLQHPHTQGCSNTWGNRDLPRFPISKIAQAFDFPGPG